LKHFNPLLVLTGLFLSFCFSAMSYAGEIVYDWVPDAGSGGSGFIRFDDANIADPANFQVNFNSTNVIEVSFMFDTGFNIEDAVDFNGMTTLQTYLDGLLYESSNGVIDGWSFNYTNAVVFIPQTNFDGVTTTGQVCFVAPCPAFTADVGFIGDLAGESDAGSWQLRSVVPLPAALPLFVSGIAMFGLMRKFLHKTNI
jgi:hypothetical protein